MSGWMYDDATGFSVTETNRSEWKTLTKVHRIFKPFATQGWALYYTMHDILPSRAKGLNVFNPVLLPTADFQPQDSDTRSQNSDGTLALHLTQEFDFGTNGDESQSQPFSDWSQSATGHSPMTLSLPSRLCSQRHSLCSPRRLSSPRSSCRPRALPHRRMLHLPQVQLLLPPHKN
ncbi:hypothetical protein B0H10DRAFT_2093198 [Mycena sp. CBHHK59/15]|nr:hypothetical protein B0H10DRAFT_2093198 [Mycena sp. CBHHK59/15]